MVEPNDRWVQVHLNLNVRGLKPSATLAINERSAALRAEGKRVVRFGLGQSPFPVPEVVVDELRSHADQKDYLPVKGLPALRDAVADFHRRRNGLPCTGDDVLIGPGSKELMFLLQLVYYGDLVIPTPSWVSYAPQAAIVGRKVHWLPTTRDSGWHLTADEVRALCREDPESPRLLILNYPSNPTGMTYTTAELEEIAAVAREHRIVLLSDEIYGELHYEGRHVSIARFYPEGTIVSGGLSKWCGAGGWRLGTLTFPRALRWLLDAMAVAASETYTSTSAPIQYAGVRAFRGGSEIEVYLWRCRRILQALGHRLHERLAACGVAVGRPQGAFYLFPDFTPLAEGLAARGVHTSAALCDRVLEDTGVAMLPGSDFGCEKKALTARIAFVDFDGAHALEAVAHMPPDEPLDDEFLRVYCPNVMAGSDRLCEWLREAAGR